MYRFKLELFFSSLKGSGGIKTPCSVMTAVTFSIGVASNAGLYTGTLAGAI